LKQEQQLVHLAAGLVLEGIWAFLVQGKYVYRQAIAISLGEWVRQTPKSTWDPPKSQQQLRFAVLLLTQTRYKKELAGTIRRRIT
jgi:hypothetical protein